MVERRPVLTFVSHLILVLGVIIIAFPLYLTFVASTQTAEQITQSIPMSLIPGTNLIESYRTALFVIQFIYGWNQYLWPLLMTTQEDMYPVVMGIKRLLGGEAYTEWNVVMATAILAMLPPALVVILMQKWFVKGLVDTEK